MHDTDLTQVQYIICGQRDTCQSVNKLFHPTTKEKNQTKIYFLPTNEDLQTNICPNHGLSYQ